MPMNKPDEDIMEEDKEKRNKAIDEAIKLVELWTPDRHSSTAPVILACKNIAEQLSLLKHYNSVEEYVEKAPIFSKGNK